MAKNSQKKPESAKTESTQGNEKGQLQVERQAKDANCVAKKPKRKYKTEVEKLRELQNGLEVTTSRRSDMVATVQEKESNQCESNEAKNEGDSPKTGIAE
jgi:hypothetical protein